MIVGTYRKRAGLALLAATAVSASVLGVGVLSALAGSHAFRRLASTIAHLCVRVWASVPGALQIVLGISVAITLLSGGLWLLSASVQWRRTAHSIRALRRQDADPPPRIRTILTKHALDQQVKVVRRLRPFALTVGLIVPRIMVSTGLIEALEDDELEAVLLHEQSHLRNKDPLYSLLARALTTAFFYVPVVRILALRHQAAVELAADEHAIATQGGSISLSSAMFKLLRTRPSTAVTTQFTGVADLRLSRLLERDADLPRISRRSVLQSAGAIAAMLMPMAAIYGLVGALNHLAFISQCIV